MASQEDRSRGTREALLAAFRQSLIAHGVEGTKTAWVLQALSLSKGAMYHHFPSKTAIIEAVFEEDVCLAIDHAVQASKGQSEPAAQLRRACLGWLDWVQQPDIMRILYEVGPAGLGTRRAREIEATMSLPAFEHLLPKAAEGTPQPINVKWIARALNAVMQEAALHYRQQGASFLPELEQTLDALIPQPILKAAP